MVAATDATVVVTEFLRSLYARELQSKIFVVHDGIENDALLASNVGSRRSLPTALLVTARAMHTLPQVFRAPLDWRLRIVGNFSPIYSERIRNAWRAMRDPLSGRWPAKVKLALDPRISRIPWSLDTVGREVKSAQVGVIPIDTTDDQLAQGSDQPSWRVRSENRLTLFMGAGLPVIASEIPSYRDVLSHGHNGFFARTPSDWRRYFRALRNPALRVEIGARARASVLPRFSIA
jgi:hypothetical protein